MKLKRWILLCTLGSAMELSAQALAQTPSLADALVSCLLEPRQVAAAASPVPGVVGQIDRERGDRVKKGDKLFELESSVERASLQMVEARWRFVRGKWERNQLLIQENVLSAHEADELRQEWGLAQAALAEAQAVLARRSVYSPLEGVVVERMVSVGEYVKDNAVLRVASVDTLHAELTLRAEARGRVRVGQTLRLQVPGQPVLTGRVTIVDPYIDAASATFAVRAEVANPSGRVLAGWQCRL